jgi:hypothetical protein
MTFIQAERESKHFCLSRQRWAACQMQESQITIHVHRGSTHITLRVYTGAEPRLTLK